MALLPKTHIENIENGNDKPPVILKLQGWELLELAPRTRYLNIY